MELSKSAPNLFNYATSELSQDAFICWLLAWADPSFKESKLHPVATELITELLNYKIPLIKEVTVKRQYKNIDVVVTINGNHAILIEDKVHSMNHSNQLLRYAELLKGDFDPKRISTVYFKTGDQSQYEDILNKGYRVYHRKDFLKLLVYGQKLGIENSTYLDFLSYLSEIEKKVNSYRELSIHSWIWDSWKGFYMELQSKLSDGNWNYVPQKNGGFLGFWWNWRSAEYQGKLYEYYLQLEHDKFCFKLQTSEREHAREVRDHFRTLLYPMAAEHQVDIRQNGRIGKTMTIAALNYDVRKADEHGKLDMNATVMEIRRIEKMMNEVVKSP